MLRTIDWPAPSTDKSKVATSTNRFTIKTVTKFKDLSRAADSRVYLPTVFSFIDGQHRAADRPPARPPKRRQAAASTRCEYHDHNLIRSLSYTEYMRQNLNRYRSVAAVARAKD